MRNNVCYHNGDHGIGAFQSTGVRIVANSVYRNVTSGITAYGSSGGATFANNISADNGIDSPRSTGNLFVDATSTAGTTLDYDLLHLSQGGVMIIWGGASYASLAAFVAATGEETHGIEADPLWSDPDAGDLHLLAGSPAIDAANSGASGQSPVDADGNPRVDDPDTPDTGAGPRSYDDRGAYEFQPGGVSTTTTTTMGGGETTTTTTMGGGETTTTTTMGGGETTTTTTMGGGETTTTTTMGGGETTTTTTGGGATTTSTTLAREPAPEICGNCIDDDGNGLTDFEDPACCTEAQRFAMHLGRGLLRPRGGPTGLKLASVLAQSGLADVNPLAQDVFIQLRPADGLDVLCAEVPAAKFMRMHGAFKFWDRGHQVASAKGIDDVFIKVRRDGSVRFRTFGKRVDFTQPPPGRLELTVAFRNPATAEAGNRCSSEIRAFRAGRRGRLRAP